MKTNEIIAGLRKLCGQGTEYRRTVCRLAAGTLETQQKRIEELETERDESVEAIRKMLSEEYGTICEFCAHDKSKDALCAKPANGSGGWCCQNARWRGVPGGKEGNA